MNLFERQQQLAGINENKNYTDKIQRFRPDGKKIQLLDKDGDWYYFTVRYAYGIQRDSDNGDVSDELAKKIDKDIKKHFGNMHVEWEIGEKGYVDYALRVT